ncbi:hypothetical protein DFH09DRAFT_1096725 [Mycena vulgaris]|nr:hypothetical protein DFH09DRAFT_1096725 [Mycena vulgaris]
MASFLFLKYPLVLGKYQAMSAKPVSSISCDEYATRQWRRSLIGFWTATRGDYPFICRKTLDRGTTLVLPLTIIFTDEWYAPPDLLDPPPRIPRFNDRSIHSSLPVPPVNFGAWLRFESQRYSTKRPQEGSHATARPVNPAQGKTNGRIVHRPSVFHPWASVIYNSVACFSTSVIALRSGRIPANALRPSGGGCLELPSTLPPNLHDMGVPPAYGLPSLLPVRSPPPSKIPLLHATSHAVTTLLLQPTIPVPFRALSISAQLFGVIRRGVGAFLNLIRGFSHALPAPDFPVTLLGAAVPFDDFNGNFASISVAGVQGDVTTYELLHAQSVDPSLSASSAKPDTLIEGPKGFTLTWDDAHAQLNGNDIAMAYNCQFATGGASAADCVLNDDTARFTSTGVPLQALITLTVSGDPPSSTKAPTASSTGHPSAGAGASAGPAASAGAGASEAPSATSGGPPPAKTSSNAGVRVGLGSPLFTVGFGAVVVLAWMKI